MKVAIIGATGGTGHQAVLKALDLEHEVTAVVRKPGALKLNHERLKVKQADVLQGTGALEEALTGQEAVISTIGPSRNERKLYTLYSVGTQNIVLAMQKVGVSRLMCISSIGVDEDMDDPNISYVMKKIVFPLVFSKYFVDMRKMEKTVKESGLTYTIVRPPGLNSKSPAGIYRVEIAPSLPKAAWISRGDVADFLVKQLENEQYYNKVVSIAL